MPTPLIHSFAPLAPADARVLILGSMPGKRSLAEQRYYAHPQNSFWRILGAVLGFDAALPYAARCEALVAGGIAVWDVLAACRRASSLDTDIENASIRPNDLAGFLEAHPSIIAIRFNGAMAEQAFNRHILPALPPSQRAIDRLRLPRQARPMRACASRPSWPPGAQPSRSPPGKGRPLMPVRHQSVRR